MMRYTPPSRQETTVLLIAVVVSLTFTGIFIGLRPEHIFLWSLYCTLFFATSYTRKLAVALLPFAIFAVSYDWLRVYPNYRVNAIDVAALYKAELQGFGITVEGVRMTLFANISRSTIAPYSISWREFFISVGCRCRYFSG